MEPAPKARRLNSGQTLLTALVLALGALAIVFSAYALLARGGEQSTQVRLDSPRVWTVGQAKQDGGERLALAIAPVINPRRSFADWHLFAEYLEDKLGIPVDLQQRRTYGEVDLLIERGDADFALVCSGPYVRLRKRGLAKLVAVPLVHGAATYHSLFIVPRESSARSLEDLAGKSFAFSDPLSNSGALYPTFALQEAGHAPQSFFSRLLYTYGHDRSILSVAHGVVDGAAVDSLVYESMLRDGSLRPDQVRVIHKSPAFGINPIVASKRASEPQVAAVRAILLAMAEDESGKAILERLGIDRFEPGDPSAYGSIEQMLVTIRR